MSGNKQQGYECPKCKNNYSTAYSMYRHMRKVHQCDINRCVTLYCPIENCNQSYDRYNALDTHLTHVHYADIRKETFNFSDLQDFETWLRDITLSSKTKYIKRSCNNSYRYYRCHRSGLPKTSTDKINSMKSSVKIGRHCPSRIIAKITDRNVQVEFVPTHIGHECEIAKIPLSQKKRHDIACRLATATNNSINASSTVTTTTTVAGQDELNKTTSGVPQAAFLNITPHHNHGQQHLPPGAQPSAASSQSNAAAVNPSSAASTTTTATTNQQATTSAIMQNDSNLMVTLAPMKTTTAVPDQQQQQLGHPTIQQQHIISTQLQQTQSTQLTTNNSSSNSSSSTSSSSSSNNNNNNNNNNTGNMNLMSLISPNRQELTSRFEQLMSSIRCDKHASIVKAQLEVCFALIRD